MDLVDGIPRSPYESMHGIVFLPRAIDKVRAEIAGALGDYISRTFFSGMLLEFLGIEPQDFVDAVATRDSDEEVWAWIKARMTPPLRHRDHGLQPPHDDHHPAGRHGPRALLAVHGRHRPVPPHRPDPPVRPPGPRRRPRRPPGRPPIAPGPSPAPIIEHQGGLHSPSRFRVDTCAGRVDTFGEIGGNSGHIWPETGHIWPESEHIWGKTEHLARNAVNTCAGRGMPRDGKPLQAPGIIRDAVTHDPTAGGGSL